MASTDPDSPDRLLLAFREATDKADAASRLGMEVGALAAVVYRRRPDLAEAWRALPAGGAFSGWSHRLPTTNYTTQADADALVAAAADALPPDPAYPKRVNAARAILGVYGATGSMNLPRGWVRAVMMELGRRGCDVPTPASLRWHRTKLASDPDMFADDPRIPADLVRRLSERAYG